MNDLKNLRAALPPSRTPAPPSNGLRDVDTARRLLRTAAAWWQARLASEYGHPLPRGGRGTGPLSLTTGRDMEWARAQASLGQGLLEQLTPALALKNPLPPLDWWEACLADEAGALKMLAHLKNAADEVSAKNYRTAWRAHCTRLRNEALAELYTAYETAYVDQDMSVAEIAKAAGTTYAEVYHAVNRSERNEARVRATNTPVKNPRRTVLGDTRDDRVEKWLSAVTNTAARLRDTPPADRTGTGPAWNVIAQWNEEIEVLKDARAWHLYRMREEFAYTDKNLVDALGWPSGEGGRLTLELNRTHYPEPDRTKEPVPRPEPDPQDVLELMRKHSPAAVLTHVEGFVQWLNKHPDDEDKIELQWVKTLSRVIKANPREVQRREAMKTYTAKRKKMRQMLDRAVLVAYDAGVPTKKIVAAMGGKPGDMYNSVRRARTNNSEEN